MQPKKKKALAFMCAAVCLVYCSNAVYVKKQTLSLFKNTEHIAAI